MSLIELEIRPKRRLEPELRSGRSNLRSMKVSSVMEIVRIVIGITCTASFRISRIAIFKGSISGKFNYQGLHVVQLSLTQKVVGGVWGPFSIISLLRHQHFSETEIGPGKPGKLSWAESALRFRKRKTDRQRANYLLFFAPRAPKVINLQTILYQNQNQTSFLPVFSAFLVCLAFGNLDCMAAWLRCEKLCSALPSPT